MTHLKRHSKPARWPIPKKGTTFIIRPLGNLDRSIPLLILLRDMLKVCQNRKEVKRAIHEKNILVNGRVAKDEKISLSLFDTLAIVPSKKYYRVWISENRKYNLEEIKESEVNQKITKVMNKKMLKGKKAQLNLRDGNNYLSEVKCNIGESVLIDLKNKKILKSIPLKEKTKVLIVEGKHSGKQGVVEKIKEERKMAKINSDGKEINVLIKQIMAVE